MTDRRISNGVETTVIRTCIMDALTLITSLNPMYATFQNLKALGKRIIQERAEYACGVIIGGYVYDVQVAVDADEMATPTFEVFGRFTKKSGRILCKAADNSIFAVSGFVQDFPYEELYKSLLEAYEIEKQRHKLREEKRVLLASSTPSTGVSVEDQRYKNVPLFFATDMVNDLAKDVNKVTDFISLPSRVRYIIVTILNKQEERFPIGTLTRFTSQQRNGDMATLSVRSVVGGAIWLSFKPKIESSQDYKSIFIPSASQLLSYPVEFHTNPLTTKDWETVAFILCID